MLPDQETGEHVPNQELEFACSLQVRRRRRCSERSRECSKMGIVLSCCKQDGISEGEPLLQDSQKGYGSNANNDYDALQRKIEQEEQKLLAREQELTEIVNNTNDKLIDISMISNSGIVVQSHDLDDAQSEAPDEEEEEEGHGRVKAASGTAKLERASTEKLQPALREAIKRLYAQFFEGLEEQLTLDKGDDLIVAL